MNESARDLSGFDSLPQHRMARADWLILVTLVVGTLALYARTAHFDFVNFDDGLYVYANDHVLGGFSAGNVAWAFTSSWPSYWHPLTFLSLMLDAQLFGEKPGPMHIHNALLHAASSGLLFLSLLRMTWARWPSAWVAAMFAWHPLHVESVAWISERKDVLSAQFMMLCVISYARYVRCKSPVSYLMVLAALLLGLLAKPMLVTLPALLLLLDFWPLRRGLRVREKIPMLLLIVACAVVTVLVQQSSHSIGWIAPSDRLSNATVSYARYLWLTIVPRGLAIFYPLHTTVVGGHIPAWQILLSAAMLVMLTLVSVLARKRVPALLIGWLWYLLSLLPVIGVVQSGTQSHADRFTYIPLIGIFAAVAWFAAECVRRWPKSRSAITVIAVASVAGAAAGSLRQIGFWRDTYTVMTHAIDVVPDNYVAHRTMGEFYDGTGDTVAAAAEFREALRINPNDSFSYHDLAGDARTQGHDEEAIQFFRSALFADPSRAEDYNSYADLLARQGKIDDAIAVYRSGIRHAPESKQLYHNLALLLAGQGKIDEAVSLWQQAVKLDPNYADAHASLGTALIMTGQTRQGLVELQTALTLQPDRIDALKSRAWTLATHPSPLYQNGAQAEALARRAVELTHHTDPIALDILAAAEARNGKFDDAAQTAKSAAELAQQQNNATLSAQIQQRVKLYRSHQPFTSGQ